MKADYLEKHINCFLQRRVNFVSNGKIIKSGTLLLFTVKDFYLNFTILIGSSKKQVEIPYPFSFERTGNSITLDYTLGKLYHGISTISQTVQDLTLKKPNKYYNAKVYLKIAE